MFSSTTNKLPRVHSAADAVPKVETAETNVQSASLVSFGKIIARQGMCSCASRLLKEAVRVGVSAWRDRPGGGVQRMDFGSSRTFFASQYGNGVVGCALERVGRAWLGDARIPMATMSKGSQGCRLVECEAWPEEGSYQGWKSGRSDNQD